MVGGRQEESVLRGWFTMGGGEGGDVNNLLTVQ